MNNLFVKRHIVNVDKLHEMQADASELKDAKVTSPNGSILNKESRSTKLKEAIIPSAYPEVCNQLLDMILMWPTRKVKQEFVVDEFNYLIYNEGDHFKRHKDLIDKPGKPKRVFTTSTLISQSDDLEGGDLIVFDEEDNAINTSLEVGETVFFLPTTYHQVTPVTKGTREVLVAWIYEKSDVQKYTNII